MTFGIGRHNTYHQPYAPASFTPTDLSPRLWVDARDAVWSGSNLTSIPTRGADGFAPSVVGTPVKGANIRNVPSIRLSNDTMRIDAQLNAWSTGALSYFWYGASLDGSTSLGIIGSGWAGQADARALYMMTGGSGPINFANGCCTVDASHQPSFNPGSEHITDTANHTVVGALGITNGYYVDGTGVGLSAGVNSFQAATPNYGGGTGLLIWNLGCGGTTGESINADTLCWLIFDRLLSSSDVTNLHNYFTTL